MDFISKEFLVARTGEALEARLRDSDTFRQQMKSLHEASKAFSKDSGMSEKFRLRGEDENYECLTDILDNSEIAPEERAKMLTDYGVVKTEV